MSATERSSSRLEPAELLGRTMPNGATVIAVQPRLVGGDVTVLAIAHPGTVHAEYVTWRADPVGLEAWWGHYHELDLARAVADFKDRA